MVFAHKFMSNNKEVLRSIASRDLATGIQELDLTYGGAIVRQL